MEIVGIYNRECLEASQNSTMGSFLGILWKGLDTIFQPAAGIFCPKGMEYSVQRGQNIPAFSEYFVQGKNTPGDQIFRHRPTAV